MVTKKMLAILGSPRRDGNVAKMLDCAVETAIKSGWHVDVVYLYDKHIEWCRGCMACKQKAVCIMEDDIAGIYRLLKECDVVALAATTYFANVPAIVKNMFDRLVGAVMDDNSSGIPKPRLSSSQKYLLLTACNTPFPFSVLAGQSRGTLKAMKEFFHISGMRKLGTVTFAGTRGSRGLPEAVRKKIRRYWF